LLCRFCFFCFPPSVDVHARAAMHLLQERRAALRLADKGIRSPSREWSEKPEKREKQKRQSKATAALQKGQKSNYAPQKNVPHLSGGAPASAVVK
jgi:hypothetical protein